MMPPERVMERLMGVQRTAAGDDLVITGDLRRG
jgi:hypothetical protein